MLGITKQFTNTVGSSQFPVWALGLIIGAAFSVIVLLTTPASGHPPKYFVVCSCLRVYACLR